MRRFIQFILLLILILSLFPLYTRFKVVAAPVPPGVYLAGLDLSNVKDPAEIRQHLERLYSEPISVYYGQQRLILRPEDVDLHIDVEQMVTEAGQYLEGTEFLDIAIREALGLPQQRRDVPVRYMLSADKVRAWLTQVAAEYDHGPRGPRLLSPAPRWANAGAAQSGLPSGYVGVYSRDWVWTSGEPGQQLDIEASIPRVIQGLTAYDNRAGGEGDGQETSFVRSADLVVIETPAPAPTIADLERELNSYLLNFPGFAAVYVRDLQSGEEALVDADVSFSGMSTLKIGIAAAIMHRLPNGIAAGDEEAEQVGQLLDYALGESNNHAANRLLSFLGNGDITAGTRAFTEFMRSLGFVNTYMQSGYDAEVQLPEIPTPGNQRTDWDANPDSNLQTTPAEMGRMLSAIYECTLNKGILVETYPREITPDECLAILFYMTHDEFQELVWAGVPRPLDTWVIHKHGFAYESHSDVALVWGPTGPYVISIFLYRRGWMDWGISNGTMKALSRMTWNFFEFQKQHSTLERPAPIILTPPPGYSALKDDYIPMVSKGTRAERIESP